MRWGHLFGATPEVIAMIEGRFRRYQTSILIISKLTMGFGFAVVTLTVAGMLRVPFALYATITVLGSLVWVGFLITLGYYFGNVLDLVPPEFKLALALGGLAVSFLILKYINNRLTRVKL